MEIIDKSFIRAPKKYILQSLLATIAVAIILYFLGALTHAAIVAALGASTFIVFAIPNSVTAQPRRLIGGHTFGLLCGLLCYYAFLNNPLIELTAGWGFLYFIAGALSVGLAMFLMTITNTEHPPAAGTALGIVTQEWSVWTIVFVLAFAISLVIIKRLMGSQLKDLF